MTLDESTLVPVLIGIVVVDDTVDDVVFSSSVFVRMSCTNTSFENYIRLSVAFLCFNFYLLSYFDALFNKLPKMSTGRRM